MPSATWAPANSAELRWEQLGLERRVQVQRGGAREKDKGERGGGRLKGREREAKKDRRERGTWREACGRPYSTTWESSGLHTSEAAKSTGEHTHTHQNRADKKKRQGKSRQHSMASTIISTCRLDMSGLCYQLLFLLLLLQRGNWTRTPVGRVWTLLHRNKEKGRIKKKEEKKKHCVCVMM